MSKDSLEPRKAPTSEAGIAIVDAVLEATALLLERDGYDTLTTNAVARVAGVSIGSLYQYFASKEALVVGLARRLEERGRDLALDRAAQIDLEDARAVTGAFVGVMLDPQLGSLASRRALLLELPPSFIDEATRDTDGRIEQLLVGVIEALGPLLRPAPPGLMAFVAFHAIEGVVEEALIQSPEWLHDPAFAAELHRLAWGYAAPDPTSLTVPRSETRAVPTEAPGALVARLQAEPGRRPPDGVARLRPTTKRGRATVDAILAGMVATLAEQGWANASARVVAKAAGVSPGTLYRYFGDLRAVVAELARRREQRNFERLQRILTTDVALDELVRRAVGATVESSLDEPHVRHALLSEVPPRLLRDVSQPVDAALRALVQARVQTAMPAGGGHPRADPELLAFVLAHAVERVVDAAVLHRPELLRDPDLVVELSVLALRYLA